MTKILVDSELLEALAKCLDFAIDYSQRDFDHPPEPSTEWDFNAGVLVTELRAALDAPQQEAVAWQQSAAEAIASLVHLSANPNPDERALVDAICLLNIPPAHPAPSIPNGWQLVPKEPTPKMIDATWGDPIETSGQPESHNTRNHRVYRAMLSAAPKALHDGQPCSHPGCLSHISHPCEGCGRVAGMAPKPPTTDDRKDAERYQWLRSQHEGTTPMELDADGMPMPSEIRTDVFVVFKPGEDTSLEPVGSIPGELYAAIDAAMAAQRRKPDGL